MLLFCLKGNERHCDDHMFTLERYASLSVTVRLSVSRTNTGGCKIKINWFAEARNSWQQLFLLDLKVMGFTALLKCVTFSHTTLLLLPFTWFNYSFSQFTSSLCLYWSLKYSDNFEEDMKSGCKISFHFVCCFPTYSWSFLEIILPQHKINQ